MTTTSYGTWNNKVDRHCLTVEQSVVEAFGTESTDGFDVDAITADYREAINTALPPRVHLIGDEFTGPARPDEDEYAGYPVDDDGNLDIRAIVDGIDLWSIIERHATDEDEDTEQIVLVNANPGDEVPGVEISQLDDDRLTFLTREDVEAFYADCGYGPDQPDELVFAFPFGEYTLPYGFPAQTFNVPASEAQAVRDAIRNA